MVKSKGKKDNRKNKNTLIITLTIIVIIGILVWIFTRPLSEEKALKIVNKKYKEAEDVLSKVIIGTEWLNLSDECIEESGLVFCKSVTENMTEYDDLKKYISNICTKSLMEEILQKQSLVFKNVNGKLYVLASSRNTDVFYVGLKGIKLNSISSHRIIAKVECEYYVDLTKTATYTMSYDYVIEKGLTGWKTSDFTLPY